MNIEYFTNKNIVLDDEQKNIVMHLENLASELNQEFNHNSVVKIFMKKEHHQGIYLYGKVGRGKTMLMDYFYSLLDSKMLKLRVHFAQFMLKIHNHNNKIMKSGFEGDALLETARQFFSKYQVICLDEFNVNDIADAMIIERIFKFLIDQNLIFVITSNTKPQDLYLNGLQRDYFLGFISLVENEFNVIEALSSCDYRMKKIVSNDKRYVYPLTSENKQVMEDIIEDLVSFSVLNERKLNVDGREIRLSHCYKNILVASFEELCKKPLGSADYIEICKNFDIVFLLELPILSETDRNEARRFVYLIDAIYENKLNFFCSAEASPHFIYEEDEIKQEFERTVSRLIEMQSDEYIKNAR